MKLIAYILIIIFSTFGKSEAFEIYKENSSTLSLNGKFITEYFMFDKYHKKNSYIYYVFKGESYISDKILGYIVLDNKINLNRIENNLRSYNYLRYIGIELDNFGSFDYGNNYSIINDIESWTNVMTGFKSSIYNKNLFNKLLNNVFTYRNSNILGKGKLILSLQYNKDKKNINLIKDIENGYGVSAIYNLGNSTYFGSSFSIIQHNYVDYIFNSKFKENKRVKVYSFGVKKYINEDLYLAVLYSKYNFTVRNENLVKKENMSFYELSENKKNIEFFVRYRINSRILSSVGYSQSYQNNSKYIKKQIINRCFGIGLNLNISKNVSSFINYQIGMISYINNHCGIKNTKTENSTMFNITYHF